MDDKTLYTKLLGLTPPWGLETVELKLAKGEVHIRVALPLKEQWVCPECLERAPIHHHRDRSWRHLDSFQHRRILNARVPRLKCPTNGVKQIRVPWAGEGSRFTSLFEALVILWLREASVEAIAFCRAGKEAHQESQRHRLLHGPLSESRPHAPLTDHIDLQAEQVSEVHQQAAMVEERSSRLESHDQIQATGLSGEPFPLHEPGYLAVSQRPCRAVQL